MDCGMEEYGIGQAWLSPQEADDFPQQKMQAQRAERTDRMELTLNRSMLEAFRDYLKEEEKSRATVEKYVRDAGRFLDYAGEGSVPVKDQVLAYKQHLLKNYAVTSANSMLAAVNSFLRFLHCPDCTVKAFRMQRRAYRGEGRELTKEEYIRLVETARRKGRKRLELIMQTLCSTGMRVSELPFVTVESLHTRRASVCLKGKTRIVVLPRELCLELKQYIRGTGVRQGSVFVTKSGKPVDRNNVLHAMKSLCGEAGVDSKKVFPHNLRHLFAVTFYGERKDLSHLADLLGHANVNTTRIYTLVSLEEQERQVCGLGLVLTP